MKIRVKIPYDVARGYHFTSQYKEKLDHWCDDILLWGMETGMDVELYKIWNETDDNNRVIDKWAIFTVETDSAFMFALKWGASMHKKGKVDETVS